MARRNEHSREQIKDMVLSAAEKIVEEEGYGGLSARKIANAIGYTVGTLYHFFKNLDEIVLYVNSRTLAKLYAEMASSVTRCRSPRTCLIALGYAYMDFALMHRHRWNMIYAHNIGDDSVLPAWYKSDVDRMFCLVEQHLMPLSDNLSDQQIDQAAHTLWCGVHGICVLSLTRKLELEPVEMRGLAESLINNYLIGLTSDNNSIKESSAVC